MSTPADENTAAKPQDVGVSEPRHATTIDNLLDAYAEYREELKEAHAAATHLKKTLDARDVVLNEAQSRASAALHRSMPESMRQHRLSRAVQHMKVLRVFKALADEQQARDRELNNIAKEAMELYQGMAEHCEQLEAMRAARVATPKPATMAPAEAVEGHPSPAAMPSDEHDHASHEAENAPME